MHPTIELDAPLRPAEPAPLPANHHLWRNGHRWWIAIVLVDARGRRRRVRTSLGTRRLDRARARRDALLARLARSRHWRPSNGLLEEQSPQAQEHQPLPIESSARAPGTFARR